MKLLRLTLDAWRGVDHREIHFADEVTLIEGPNEIGKSTIVEAIHMLFKEMDSSNKQWVKAIQPVDRDVGSMVEAEVTTGDYHFVYTKTYNKSKQTVLKILAPKSEQLTGRQAHERASQMLDETIDTVLWDALLVEQGEKITGANLTESTSLAQALDAAAGTSSESVDDSALFTAVQAEYELYFTAKTGRSKFSDQEKALLALQEDVAAATVSLSEVEDDSGALEREQSEVDRLQAVLPNLKEKVVEHEGAWKVVETLNDSVRRKASEAEAANELYTAVNSDWLRRQQWVAKIERDRIALRELREQLAPETEQLTQLQQEHEHAAAQLASAKEHYRVTRGMAEQAASDEKHLIDTDTLRQIEKQLEQVGLQSEAAAAARAMLSDIKIDEHKLASLREAERELHTARVKRDASALLMGVTAEVDLTIAINDEPVSLKSGEVVERKTASELNLQIPGVAGIKVSPSQSGAELESDFAAHQKRFNELLAHAGVDDLADAVTVEARRLSSEQEFTRCSQNMESLLNGATLPELQVQQEDLKARIEAYLQDRSMQAAIPENLSEASENTEHALVTSKRAEEGVASAQAMFETLRANLEQRRGDFRVAEEEVRGLEAAAAEQMAQLTQARSEAEDADLENRVVERELSKASLQFELDAMQAQLASASPETIKTLLENARNTLDRAQRDLQIGQQQCAVLEDRLTKAQADGQFEALESKQYQLASLESEYRLTCTRAEAAKRLWETINKHRDSARKAYVLPLKEGIENLGKIVFGLDFSVDLDDDWKLISRTLAGKTIAFDDLSVGAKEQLGILTRLAAAGVVADQGGVPLIIDDALGFADPQRLESMGAAIASASKNCQIILLSCSPGRFMHVGNAEVVRL